MIALKYVSTKKQFPFLNVIKCKTEADEGIGVSVGPKAGFGIRNRNQGPILVSVSEPKLFFPKPKLFPIFSNFVMFFLFLVGYEFLKAWNWTLLFKNNLKISLIFGSKFGFRGPFMMEIIPHSNFQGLRLFQRAVYSGVYNRHLNERIMTFWLKNDNLITLE